MRIAADSDIPEQPRFRHTSVTQGATIATDERSKSDRGAAWSGFRPPTYTALSVRGLQVGRVTPARAAGRVCRLAGEAPRRRERE